MSRMQYALTLIIAVLSGFVGGAVSNRVLKGTSAFAENPPEQGKVLRAQRFEVVGQDGKLYAILGETTFPHVKEGLRVVGLFLVDGEEGKNLAKAPTALFRTREGAARFNITGPDDSQLSVSESGLSVWGKDADISVSGGGISLHSGSGTRTATVAPEYFHLSAYDGNHGEFQFAKLGITEIGPVLSLDTVSVLRGNPRGSATLAVAPAEQSLTLTSSVGTIQGSTVLGATPTEQNLTLSKDNKTRAIFGSASLKAAPKGTVVVRPPSSLVLFDEDEHLFWSTP